MKKLFYLLLPALFLTVISCSDKSNEADIDSEYKFQKELTIHDGNGNSADILIQSDSEEALADQTKDIFYMTTTTEDFSKKSYSIEEEANIETEESSEKDEVFVLITNVNLNPEITGYSVRSKIELGFSSGIHTRASSKQYQYAFGSSGVTGAWVRYSKETCPLEYLTAKLSRKKSKYGIYASLGTKELFSVGDVWNKTGSITYYKFKLTMKAKNQCTGTAYYNLSWLK